MLFHHFLQALFHKTCMQPWILEGTFNSSVYEKASNDTLKKFICGYFFQKLEHFFISNHCFNCVKYLIFLNSFLYLLGQKLYFSVAVNHMSKSAFSCPQLIYLRSDTKGLEFALKFCCLFRPSCYLLLIKERHF